MYRNQLRKNPLITKCTYIIYILKITADILILNTIRHLTQEITAKSQVFWQLTDRFDHSKVVHFSSYCCLLEQQKNERLITKNCKGDSGMVWLLVSAVSCLCIRRSRTTSNR